ncbi:helix-turn-helix protein [Actinokineospora spheciospongiae]|nr:helix-turn-helix protein [Actinokineospora spheciospongiae]
MPGNAELGAVLRELRTARGLTLGAVASQVRCAPSLLSYVESGQRQLHEWLAAKLDEVYGTGGVVVSLLHGTVTMSDSPPFGVPSESDVFVVSLLGGEAMPLSRRELLASLSVGVAGTVLNRRFERVVEALDMTTDPLDHFAATYNGFQVATRSLHPHRLIDGLTGSVAVLDGLRRRAGSKEQPQYHQMQARFAESLSWLSEEAGDLPSAMYWIDRASQWGQAADWHAMSAYGFVRRSMMVVSFSGDGRRAIDNATTVFSQSQSSPRMRGLAAKQIAFGHALLGDQEASTRTLDQAVTLLSKPVQGGDALLGQRSVLTEDLFTIFQTTCDIYLGRGEQAIASLAPRLDSLSSSSARTATITRAKVARAYANIGQPEEAAHHALAALDDIEAVGSQSARAELGRAARTFARWRGREDMQAVLRRLQVRTV